LVSSEEAVIPHKKLTAFYGVSKAGLITPKPPWFVHRGSAHPKQYPVDSLKIKNYPIGGKELD
jgi:hypothetical protein